jgi:hypothetical protein
VQLLQSEATPDGGGGPVASLVRVDLSLRGTVAMWGWATPGVLAHVPGDEQMLLGMPLVDRPYTQAISFSLWRSADEAIAFGYRDEGHRDAVNHVSRAQPSMLAGHSSARFRPYRATGTWQGRNPLDL